MKKLGKTASWLGAISGAGLPALSYFTDYAPPLFAGVTTIITALAAAILLIAAARKQKAESVRTAAVCLGVVIPLLIVYSLFLAFTTVVGPGEHGSRYQIGFGLAQFSLTDTAKADLKDNPTLQPKDLMMYEAAFDQDRVAILWQTWSIYLAAAILIVLYFAGFVLWTAGFALLAKR